MTESNDPHKAQLDKAEREQLEDIVTQMRERVEDNVRFQLTQRELNDRPEQIDELDSETEQLVEAIDLEATDDESWSEALDKYVTSVGYTIVNRLTALRCMEVREFIDEEVTVFKQTGLTPAAETLVQEEFLLEDEAILEAYHNACDTFAEEIEILFDRSSAYSLIDPDDDTFEELCEMLDSVPSRIWRADDVLGWVYEYYNVKLLDDLRRKGDREGLEPEDVPPANQFYTPHWVVRMLTDNSLGKLYLEHTGELQDVIETQRELSPDERKNRPLSPDESSDIADFCTYLVSSEKKNEPTDFNHPSELRVIDPACGSGHFLLYAFDILERIWRAETNLSAEKIPQKILHNNLYGVDLDMRACQLTAFNLYLKGRTRAETEGADEFEMSEVGIVCADTKVADVSGVNSVFKEVAGDDSKIEGALESIFNSFEQVHGLGSLLDVRGVLGDIFGSENDTESLQITLEDDPTVDHTLGQILHSLRVAVDDHQESNSLLAKDLRSFLRLLDILAQDYDVALMNPPYGSRNRMPESVKTYVRDHYRYRPEFYINFFEVCNSLTKTFGRIGMLVPRTFMYKSSFENFRQDFVGDVGTFDFLAEYGIGVLDNATVRTVGTVVRAREDRSQRSGSFYRLHDLDTREKEAGFISAAFSESIESDVRRQFEVQMSEFSDVPGTPLSYWIPSEIRNLYGSETVFDAERGNVDRKSLGTTRQGLITSNNDRFVRKHWENDSENSVPFATGGEDAWILPKTDTIINWHDNGGEVRRIPNSSTRTYDVRFDQALVYNRIKETGRRFGLIDGDSIFSDTGMAFVPESDGWPVLAYANSDLATYLVLGLTIGRHWNVTEVGKIPWPDSIANLDDLGELGKLQSKQMVKSQALDVTSPYYIGPQLLPANCADDFFYSHPHTNQISGLAGEMFSHQQDAIKSSVQEAERLDRIRLKEVESTAKRINEKIFDSLNVSKQAREAVLTENFLRTSEDPTNREVADPDIGDLEHNKYVQSASELINHFAMEAVREEDDGIIPLYGAEDQPNMLDRIVEQFRNTYGEYAEDRLVEIDRILGTESAAEEAYPNLHRWISEDLFEYHVNQMENRPIMWKLTTERLLTDSNSEGFACFLDYHSLDSTLFDRLSNQYLEAQKAQTREQRSAANRRQSDNTLSSTEQAEATMQYERCASRLNQINVFEDLLQELGSTAERNLDYEGRQFVEDLAPKVTTFREETQDRVDTLAELREQKSEQWFQDTFSDNFWNAVDEMQEEWIDALKKLEFACKEYAKPADESVEAHLADLFDYFNWRIKGSDHYSSTGILFMTYYFEREGANLLNENGEPFDTLSDDERLLASLATGLDDSSIVDNEFLEAIAADKGVNDIDKLQPLAEFKALAEEIDDRCKSIFNQIPSNWRERALSEITTEGYKPNQKHGVEINIKPLAEAEIVPKTVDKNVL